MVWIFAASGVLAIALSMVTLVLSQRQKTSSQTLNRWIVATGLVWVLTIMVLCAVIIELLNGAGQI